MSYSPTQIQHTQVQEDEEEQSNGSESPQESESSHSYIATQVQDNDDTMYDEEDDQPENPEQYHEEDNLEQKNKEEEHNELEFDEEEKEPKKSSKKKKKKSEVKEKKRRQKKDDDDDYQDKDEESDKSANEEDENNEEVDTKKKRKRLQKGKEKRKKRKESNNDEASPSNEEESSLIHDEENEGSSRSKQNVDDDDEFNKFVLKEVKSRRSASSDKILENTAQPQATELIKRINAAYFDDVEAYHKRKPALNKLQLLPEVIESCKKIYLQSHLITEGILGALEKWIVPDKDLPHPSINIQTGVLTILNDLPVCSSYEGDEKFITRELLKSSKIPKTVKQIANNPSTTPSNRKLAKKIVERWSRLVYQLPSEYGEMYKKQPLSSSMKEDTQTSKPTPTPSFSKSSEPIQRKKPKSNSIRASIPKKESFDFKRLPPSKVTQKKEKEENEVHKRMLNVGTRKR